MINRLARMITNYNLLITETLIELGRLLIVLTYNNFVRNLNTNLYNIRFFYSTKESHHPIIILTNSNKRYNKIINYLCNI